MAIRLKINKLITDKELKLCTQSDYNKIQQIALNFKYNYVNYNCVEYSYYKFIELRTNEIIKNNTKNILDFLDNEIKINIFKSEILIPNNEKLITTINNYKIPKERIDNFLDIMQSIKLIKQIGGSAKIKHDENLYDDITLLCKHYDISNANLIINKLFLLRHFENEIFNNIEEKPHLKIKK